MSEDGSTTTREEDWSNLPDDLLSRIVDDLGLMELMNLRGVCKDWRNVSSKALRKAEPYECYPWFLLYDIEGEGSKSNLLLTDLDKICTATLPELEGATCLASCEGWLLVFRGGSMFFFCPFSMGKIDLPSCPFTELSGHTAAFSAPPTSEDCVVVVIRRCSDYGLELHSLSRGHETWVKHSFTQQFGKITGALFSEGMFHFLDNMNGLVKFDAAAAPDTQKWNAYHIIERPQQARPQSSRSLKYCILRGKLESIDFKKLGLDENRFSISSCGTLYQPYTCRHGEVIPDESIEAAVESESRHLKGVWILPRYHTPSMDHRW